MPENDRKTSESQSFVNTLRVLFILTCTTMAFVLSPEHPDGELRGSYTLAAAAFVISSLLVVIESRVKNVNPKSLVFGASGLLIGLIFAYLINNSMLGVLLEQKPEQLVVTLSTNLFCGYFGAVLAVRYSERIEFRQGRFAPQSMQGQMPKVLDTSVLIDGRIADIYKTGIIEGRLILPHFVLEELQKVADSEDPQRRKRGRRGLEVVKQLQKDDPTFEITRHDFPDQSDVDSKLVALARKVDGKLITNDFNLNNVAEIQDVPVVNINKLAMALKPPVLPGEELVINLVKRGRDPGQGVAYLDDGTMVVVDNASEMVGSTQEIVVTSILQTMAGRMIFGRLREGVKMAGSDNWG